ncbi:TrbC/VirB2 family protein [Yersinia pestis]|uniref:TrbC/VirB2 family protein n=1 Tax=Yersinia pestis TaxID=632 RepID=UPI0018DD1580|nr:TrbC/VirB2 family protein [Yersinia pestis]MBI0265233.1 TrbC/VirB2 family protein [Yersinia pestis subsp. pestis]
MSKNSYRFFMMIMAMVGLAVIAEPALAADVSTKATGFLDKIIEFLTDLRKPAITICALLIGFIALFKREYAGWIVPLVIGILIFILAPYIPEWLA